MGNINNVKEIKIPKNSVELAEFIGIVLGDGCISHYYKPRFYSSWSVTIAGNLDKDYNYLFYYVKPLIKKLFGINIYKKRPPDSSTRVIYLVINGKMLVKFLNEMGLESGNKINNQTTIPKWIFSNKKYLMACLRGLYDTDGCLYELLPQWPGLFQLNFDNHNISLLRDVRSALIKLNFHPSKIHGTRTKHGNRIDLTRKEEIKKFYKEIGSSNHRLKNKFERI